jgi:hypothetical protein
MAPTAKKKMKAVLKVEPWAEMDGKRKAWLLSIPAFAKTFKTIEYSEDVELDPRKWDPGKLSKALEALVRYELKLLDAGVGQWQKKVEKKGPLGQRDAERALPAFYKDTVKEIHDKCSLALDELAADKGDNRKGLRDGKAALRKLDAVDLDKIFAVPRAATASAFRDLAAALDKAGDDEKQKEAAFTAAAKAADTARKGFDGDGKDAQAAVKFLLKTASDIGKNKNANPVLIGFGKEIESYEKYLVLFSHKLDAFEIDLDEAANDIKGRKIDAKDAKVKASRMAGATSLDKSGGKVEDALYRLKSSFSAVEKELK